MAVEGDLNQIPVKDGNTKPPEKRQRGPNKKLKYGIPSRNFELEKHFDILTAYVSIYGQKQEAISVNALSVISDISVDLVMRNNKFYVDTGFLIQDGRNHTPTKGLLDFIKNKRLHHDDEAKSELRAILSGKWFLGAVKASLEYKSPAEEKSLIDALAFEVSASPDEDDDALKVFLELMVYSEVLVKTSEGKYELMQQPPNGSDMNNLIEKDVIQGEKQSGQESKSEEETSKQVKPQIETEARFHPREVNVTIQFVLNIEHNTSPERIKEITKAIVDSISDSYHNELEI